MKATALLTAAAGALLLSVLASPAIAGVRLTNTTTAQYRLHRFVEGPDRGEEVPYGLLLDRLNLVAAADDFTSGVRVDGMLFFDPPTLSDGAFRDDARIERFDAGYDLDVGDGDLHLTVGDFYRQLGRGILLSLRKEDEIGVDVSVRGGQVAWLGDQLDAAIFAGRSNPVNLDNVSEKFVAEPEDIIAGTEIKLRELGPVQIGVHGVYLGIHQPLLPAVADDDRVVGAGGSVELPSIGDVGSLYLEADWQQTRRAGEDSQGLAAYGVAELYLDALSVVIAGLYLDQIGMDGSPNNALGSPFSYNQPPTLERIDQEVLNSRDVRGARVRVDYALSDGDVTIYANGMLRQTDPGVTAQVTQIHTYGGFDLYYDEGSSRLSASGGWRDEQNTPPAGAATDLKSMLHAEGDWQHAFSGWALHIATLNELRTLVSPTGTDEYTRGSTLIGVEFGHDAGWMSGFADQFALTFEVGYDDQDQSESARNLFYAGIVDWTLDSRLRLRATAGTQRGGLKCVGGVCRIFPEFAGGRLTLITTLDL